MKLRIRSSILAGALALISTSGLVAVNAPAAHAASCGSDRVLASNPTDLYGYNLGVISNKHLGKLYIGYIPSCRMEYAEVHWDQNADLSMIGDNYIWLQDAHGHQAGKADIGSLGQYGEYGSSNLVPIDSFGYSYSQPRLHIGLTFSGGRTPTCRPTDYYGNGHSFATGGSEASHNWQVCGI